MSSSKTRRSPHALRHTFATISLSEGEKDVYYVSEQLGHKDINLTVAVYTKGDHASRAGALDDLDPPAALTNF